MRQGSLQKISLFPERCINPYTTSKEESLKDGCASFKKSIAFFDHGLCLISSKVLFSHRNMYEVAAALKKNLHLLFLSKILSL